MGEMEVNDSCSSEGSSEEDRRMELEEATLLGDLSGQEIKTMVSTSELQKTRGTFLHKLTARAIIRDYEDGSLDTNEAEHEHGFREQGLRGPRLRAGGDVLPGSCVKPCSVLFRPYMKPCSASAAVCSESSLKKDTEFCLTESAVDWEDGAVPRQQRIASFVQMYAPPQCLSVDLQDSVSSLATCPTSPLFSPPCPLPPPPPLLLSNSLRPPSPPPVVAHEDLLHGLTKRALCKSPARRSMKARKSTADMTPPALSSELFSSVTKTPSPIPLSCATTEFRTYGHAWGTDFWEDFDSKDCISAQSAAGLAEDVYDEAEVIDSCLISDISDAASLTGLHTAEVKSSPFGMSKLSHLSQLSYQGAPNVGFSAFQPKVKKMGSASPGSFSRGLFGMSSQSGSTCPTRTIRKAYMGEHQPPVFSFGSKSSGPMVVAPGSSPGKEKELSGVPFEQGFSFGARSVFVGSTLGGVRPHAMEMKAALAKAKVARETFQILSHHRSALPTETERFTLSQPLRASLGAPLTAPEDVKLKWMKIFFMQHPEGYWECTAELGEFIKVDVDSFANVFLKNKGICSLGVRAHADILRLVATVLVLQLMRVEKLEEGKLLRTLFCLDDSPQPRSERWEAVKRAVDWVCWADRQYPCVYSRLEFGWSWESSTRQLLGYEHLPARSPLSSLATGTPLPVH
ncbi:protein mono-ADP-ribosyltransferase PARP4-like [Centroberyx affinis]|uniref:protein mono-ADP-ribosyltransferase PARP4-like n=1 Tax=Centroberyx affinis TaxID=166261 RepID=UPI003A5C59F9